MLEIYIGFDPAERRAWDICAKSIIKHASFPPSIHPIGIQTLDKNYRRKTENRNGQLWDCISNAPMATEFALARFFVPFVSNSNICLFVDCDFMFRSDVFELIDYIDSSKAISVVKHEHHPKDKIKMDGQIQTDYERKNWSSLMLFNMTHAKSKAMTMEYANEKKGLWLHQFKWLKDEQIGEIPKEWNHLVGVDKRNPEAKGVHFTLATPDVPGNEKCEFSKEWREFL